MKRIFVITFSLLAATLLPAQTMRDMWLAMPDSLVPYLNNSLRTEVADYVEMKNMKPEVKNLLGDTTRIDRLTTDYMLARLNNSSILEMRRLPGKIATVWTWLGPAPDSRLRMFDANWNELPVADTFSPSLERPDSMSVERFEELKRLMEPSMTELHLSPLDNSLTADYSLFLLSREEKKTLVPILKQRKYILQ